jgi:quercetin 2,3-dioxygenase
MALLARRPLGFPWTTQDPFLFCVHHLDHYPAGNERLGPRASLTGRALGQDFDPRASWRMYHGREVPGFPQHPHRGFETVTIVRRGLVDHSDSLGAAARFGGGDVQWLTAGAGINHSEMFPLLDPERENPLELFQIWLNLPASDKLVEPHFTMLWRESLPVVEQRDDLGRLARVTVVAGRFGGDAPPPPPPHSWASRDESDVAIWTVKLDPGARWVLPRAQGEGTQRSLFFFDGDPVDVAGTRIAEHAALELDARRDAELTAGANGAEFLLLQGRPIAEPVAQHGPFVMNTRAELQRAFLDYERTRFGGWPWPSEAPTHPRERGRFARHADGRLEERT